MDKNNASLLVDEIARRGIALPRPNDFKALLERTLALERLPSQKLPFNTDDMQVIRENGSYTNVELRRIVSNSALAFSPDISIYQLIKDAIKRELGIFSSDSLLRNIRYESWMRNIMIETSSPFSLLAKLTIFGNIDNEERPLVITRRPLLLIPGLHDVRLNHVKDWEESHTRYEVEKLALGGIIRGQFAIPKEEYLRLT